MNAESIAHTDDSGWTRVSSFKPQVVRVLLVVIVVCASTVLLGSEDNAVPLIAAGASVALGLIALTTRVVHRRGNDYRVSTLFYSEVATVDEVCMTVTRKGPVWTRIRIHLRRPARFGWTITFVPNDEALSTSRPFEQVKTRMR